MRSRVRTIPTLFHGVPSCAYTLNIMRTRLLFFLLRSLPSTVVKEQYHSGVLNIVEHIYDTYRHMMHSAFALMMYMYMYIYDTPSICINMSIHSYYYYQHVRLGQQQHVQDNLPGDTRWVDRCILPPKYLVPCHLATTRSRLVPPVDA